MKKFLIIAVVLIVTTNAFGQTDSIKVSIPMEQWEIIVSEKKNLIDSLTVLNKTIQEYKDKCMSDSILINKYKINIDSLSSELALLFDRIRLYKNDSIRFVNDSLTIVDSLCFYKGVHLKDSIKINELKFNIDSLISVNREISSSLVRYQNDSLKFANDSIRLHREYVIKNEEVNKRLELAELKSARADTISIQMMITYLNLKCSDDRISELRNNFTGIPDAKLRSEYKEYDQIFMIYSDTRKKIIELANDELKAKKISSAESALYKDMYINEYKQQLNNLQYVKMYYNNDEYTSPYLNNMLKLSYEALESKNLDLLKQVIEL